MNDRGSRQGFLGPHAQALFRQVNVAVVGLGGGGSHIVQQLAHAGFRRFTLFDPDVVESTNLNRLVGATSADVAVQRKKVEVATRVIGGLCDEPVIHGVEGRWQDQPERLRSCDLVFGCLDGFAERRELEAATRRYLLPLLDIGLDVTVVDGEAPQMAGQVILSMPGASCMQCLGFLSPENLAREAARYGDAGIRPQVIWGNGVLASVAVGIAIDLLTDWTRSLRGPVYLSYDGNKFELKPHVRLGFVPGACSHFPWTEIGDPQMTEL